MNYSWELVYSQHIVLQDFSNRLDEIVDVVVPLQLSEQQKVLCVDLLPSKDKKSLETVNDVVDLLAHHDLLLLSAHSFVETSVEDVLKEVDELARILILVLSDFCKGNQCLCCPGGYL